MKSKVKELTRKKVLHELTAIDLQQLKVKESLISLIVPASVFAKGKLESFEKYNTLTRLRQKSLKMIFSLIETDLLEKMDEESSSAYLSYLRGSMTALASLYILCLQLEEELLRLSDGEYEVAAKNKFWGSFGAISIYLDELAKQVKEDSFSIKFSFDPLCSMIRLIQEDAKCFLENHKSTIDKYCSEIIETIISLVCNSNSEKKITDFTFNNIRQCYFTLKETLQKIDSRFVFDFSSCEQVFNVQNTYFLKFQEDTLIMSDETIEDSTIKYSSVIESINRLSAVINTLIEKESNLII